jgi:hypothetical protein
MDYPGSYMNALATLRHGPIIVLHEAPGSSTTYQPLGDMLNAVYGHQVAHPINAIPLLPPMHILQRTSTNPPHFNATKSTERHTSTEPEHPTGPCILGEDELPRQLDTGTTPPPAAKRPKTSPQEAKRAMAADWDGMNTNQRKNWRKRHK